MPVKIVVREREIELTFDQMDLSPDASDAQIIVAAERHMEQKLENFVVTRQGENVMVSPSPVFG